MTSTAFRESLNSLGWSRRDEPVNTTSSTPILSKLSSLNPFRRGGYVELPTHEGPGAPLPAPTRREEEEGWFARESSIFVHRPSRTFRPGGRQVGRRATDMLTRFLFSESMGPSADLRRLQSGCASLLCGVLRPVSGPVGETAKVCYLVCATFAFVPRLLLCSTPLQPCRVAM